MAHQVEIERITRRRVRIDPHSSAGRLRLRSPAAQRVFRPATISETYAEYPERTRYGVRVWGPIITRHGDDHRTLEGEIRYRPDEVPIEDMPRELAELLIGEERLRGELN
jgi:hypothetical protein